MTTFLLDTCVISESSLPQPRESVSRFIDRVENFYIPVGALMEIQLGLTQICETNPLKAVRLSNWYFEVLRSGIPVLDTDQTICEIWGILAAHKQLRNLYIPRTDGKQQRNRAGQDLHIAAAALAHRLPIATFNVRDFMLINEHFPLPGIYDPDTGVWHARMEPLTMSAGSASDRTEVGEHVFADGLATFS